MTRGRVIDITVLSYPLISYMTVQSVINMSNPMSAKPRRKIEPEQRRAEILHAAFACFAERGFAMTRMEDVASRAGIAKGTVYLHFPDKEALFISLVSGIATPLLGQVNAMVERETTSPRQVLEAFYFHFRREVLDTDRRHLLRLVIAEGAAFPTVTEYYHREIISQGLDILRKVLERAAKNGELRNPAIARTPQIVMAPALMAIIWKALFEQYEHLNADRLFADFIDTLFTTSAGSKT